MKPVTAVWLAALATTLMSCGSSPPVRYYSLQVPPVPAASAGPEARIVGLGPFRVPEYLKRSQMVTRGAGTEIEVHEFARWAEPLDKAIPVAVAAGVDSRLDGVAVVAYPYLEFAPVDVMVTGQVDRFDCDASGQVVLQLQWAAVTKEHTDLIPPQRSRYETHAASPADPGSIARAMNEALDRFGDDIASQLGKALQGAPDVE